MSQLKVAFDYSCNQFSPVKGDVQRTVSIDENGKEYVEFLPVDYPAIIKSNGKVTDWQLSKMLAAGISPAIPIHTGLGTRIEGVDVINQAVAAADEIISESTKTE